MAIKVDVLVSITAYFADGTCKAFMNAYADDFNEAVHAERRLLKFRMGEYGVGIINLEHVLYVTVVYPDDKATEG